METLFDIEKMAHPPRTSYWHANFFEKTGVLGTIPASWVGKLIKKKMHLGVDFFLNLWFNVSSEWGKAHRLTNKKMNTTFDSLSCEEVFELNAMCDQWQNDAIEAQDADAEWIRANTKLVNISEK